MSSREEISGGLVGLGRISGKVIPNSIQVDALSACHKPLSIGTVNIEVPDPGIQKNLRPWLDSRDGSIHDNEFLDLVWIQRRIGVRHHVADVVRNDERFIVLQ